MTAGPDPTMTIGVFARRSRLSVKALRLYERLGLLVPHAVDADTGYRHYATAQLADARLVARLRAVGMPLADVAAVLAARGDAGADRLVASWWAGEEHRVAVRRELVRDLRREWAPAGAPEGEAVTTTWEVRERRMRAWTVLTEQSHVTPTELPGFIGDAIGRLHDVGQLADGGFDGPSLAIYHGQVNEDSDGPVEVCVVLDPVRLSPAKLDPPPGVTVREEPAHQELFVTLTRRQVVYPDILAAYEAVWNRAEADGREITGPPREVYFTDLMAADDDDDVCDVAFPVA